MQYNDPQIHEKVQVAIDLLFKHDSFLLESDVNERAVSHKLAEYLQLLFLEWNVDCEYNRKGLDTKELDGIQECAKQRTTDRVFPDIIIHRRNTDDNLLVVEIKTISPETICDERKLELFTEIGGKYKYKLGLFVKFQKTAKPILDWYKAGGKQLD
jgi:hypothetical protein